MRPCSVFGVILILLTGCFYPVNKIKHVKVYDEREHLGGYPANNGIWLWNNEILVGFSQGYDKNLGPAHQGIGYVRSVQRPDGKVVTIYYFQDKEHPESFIGCTIWNPDLKSLH